MNDSENLVAQISKKLQDICQKLNLEKSVYERMGPLEKINKIQELITPYDGKLKKQRIEQEKSQDTNSSNPRSNDENTKICHEISELLKKNGMINEELLNSEKVLKKLSSLLKEMKNLQQESMGQKLKISSISRELEAEKNNILE